MVSEIWVPLGYLDEIELTDVHFFVKFRIRHGLAPKTSGGSAKEEE